MSGDTTPEKALWCAIIDMAVKDFKEYKNYDEGIKRLTYTSAVNFFMSPYFYEVAENAGFTVFVANAIKKKVIKLMSEE